MHYTALFLSVYDFLHGMNCEKKSLKAFRTKAKEKMHDSMSVDYDKNSGIIRADTQTHTQTYKRRVRSSRSECRWC